MYGEINSINQEVNWICPVQMDQVKLDVQTIKEKLTAYNVSEICGNLHLLVLMCCHRCIYTEVSYICHLYGNGT